MSSKKKSKAYKIPEKSKVGGIDTSGSYIYRMQPTDFQAQVDSYTSWVYVCSSRNAQTVASTPLRLYVSKPSKDVKMLFKTRSITSNINKYLNSKSNLSLYTTKAYEIEELTEHPFLDLMRQVNPFMNQFDLLELLQLYLELTGNAYLYVAKDTFGTPAELWLFPSQYMQIVPSKESFISGYLYRNGTQQIPFTPDEIIHFKFLSPRNLYYGYSPLVAISLQYSLNQSMQLYEKNLLDNQGVPSGIATITEPVGQEEFDRVRQQWNEQYRGFKNAGKTIFLSNGVKYDSLTIPPKDMSFVKGRNMTRDEILSAYGVPVSKVTTDNVNLANAQIGEQQYARDTILPRLRKIEQMLNQSLLPMYDDNIFVAFDNPVPDDKDFELRENTGYYNAGVLTLNETREMLGYEEVEGGDSFKNEYSDVGEPTPVDSGKIAENVISKINKILEDI